MKNFFHYLDKAINPDHEISCLKCLSKKIDECPKCGAKLIPDLEAKPDHRDEWDGHTYKFPCDCLDKNLRVCSG